MFALCFQNIKKQGFEKNLKSLSIYFNNSSDNRKISGAIR